MSNEEPKEETEHETKEGIEREIKEVFISDGKYKYVYVDTGEDVQ